METFFTSMIGFSLAVSGLANSNAIRIFKGANGVAMATKCRQNKPKLQ